MKLKINNYELDIKPLTYKETKIFEILSKENNKYVIDFLQMIGKLKLKEKI